MINRIVVCMVTFIFSSSLFASGKWHDGWRGGRDAEYIIASLADLDREQDIGWLLHQANVNDDPWAQFFTGVYYARKLDQDSLRVSLGYLRRSSLALSDSMVIDYLAWVELLNGNHENAIDLFSRNSGKQRMPQVMNLAHAYLLHGDQRQAREFYQMLFDNTREGVDHVTTLGVRDLKLFKWLNLCNSDCDRQIEWFKQTHTEARTRWLREW